MSHEPNKKPIATGDLITSLIALLKSGAIIFVLFLLDSARRREDLAKRRAALAAMELKANEAKRAIEQQVAKKTPDQVIADFLGR